MSDTPIPQRTNDREYLWFALLLIVVLASSVRHSTVVRETSAGSDESALQH